MQTQRRMSQPTIRTRRLVLTGTVLASLAAPAAWVAAADQGTPVVSGRTAWGEEYRVLLRAEGDERCLTPRLQWSATDQQEICTVGADPWFDAQVADHAGRPWLAYGASPAATARVRVVLDDLSGVDAQVGDHASLPGTRLFHLPLGADTPAIKLVEALDAAGGVVDSETVEEGPFRRLRGGRLDRRRSWSALCPPGPGGSSSGSPAPPAGACA